jgi:hypothetical protein
MFFATHSKPAQKTLRIFRWPNANPTLTQSDATIGVWKTMSDGSGGAALGPDGRGWLSRCDSRITSAWNSGDTQKVPTKITGTYNGGEVVELQVPGRLAFKIKPTTKVDPQRRWVWDFPFWLAINGGFGNVAHRY